MERSGTRRPGCEEAPDRRWVAGHRAPRKRAGAAVATIDVADVGPGVVLVALAHHDEEEGEPDGLFLVSRAIQPNDLPVRVAAGISGRPGVSRRSPRSRPAHRPAPG